jgi:hypothetical protein
VKAVLEWHIKADVDGLTEGGASSGDVLHLHSKLLDLVNYQCHHVALVAVEDEDRDDVFRSHLDIRLQYLVSPRQHNCLVHPCGILTVVVMGCGESCKLLLRNVAICLPLKHHDDGSTIPYPAMVTATVAHFVSLVKVQMWMVFFPMSSRVHLEFTE